jgi:signal transduction histidine kinase
LDGKHYTICAIDDISHEKRREELEKIFFHDILNTASAVKGLAEVVEIVPPEKKAEFLQNIRAASIRLIDEINSHRLLATAETGELSCTFSPIDSLECLRDAMLLFSHHDSAKDRHLVLAPTTESVSFETDCGLLSRVIVNMIKNALEATPEGGTVTVDCRNLDGWVRFSVHNPVFIPERVALQIFRRSFSTKGRGRGLGTYGMRLISEKYLNGRVTFTTSEASGTVFMASYPTDAVA